MILCPGRSALAEDMGELPAAEVVRLGGEMKDTALVPVRSPAKSCTMSLHFLNMLCPRSRCCSHTD